MESFQNRPAYNVALDRLYIQLQKFLNDSPISSTNIVPTIISLMKTVETYKEVSGVDKRNMIIHVLNRFVREQMGDTQETKYIKFIIDNTAKEIIDTLISVDKKQLVIKTKKYFSKLFSCCR